MQKIRHKICKNERLTWDDRILNDMSLRIPDDLQKKFEKHPTRTLENLIKIVADSMITKMSKAQKQAYVSGLPGYEGKCEACAYPIFTKEYCDV
jgi:hypothetical protein